MLLVINNDVKILFSQSLRFEQQPTLVIPINTTAFGPGIAQVSLFASRDEILAERLLFMTPQKKINVTIECGKDGFSTREAVPVKIGIRDAAGIYMKSNFNVSVFKDSLDDQTPYGTDLFEDVWLYGNLTGTDPVKGFFQWPPKEQNDFMATQTAKRLQWKSIFEKNAGAKTKLSNYFFKGKVVRSSTGETVPDSTFITFYLNNNDFIYGTHSDKRGVFVFPLFKAFGDEEIFYGLEQKNKPLNDAKIIPEDYELLTEIEAVDQTREADKYYDYTRLKKSITDSYQYYTRGRIAKEGKTDSDIEGDFEVDMSKFELFKSMPEVLSNIVNMVKYFQTNGEEKVRVFLKKTASYANGNPVYIIDGIMTDNISYFLNLDPSKISKIKVLRQEETLSRYGILGKNGIIAVETTMPDVNEKLPRTERSLFITGISQPLEFKNKVYSEKELPAIPDLRSSLYWNPSLATKEDGADFVFYTSDMTGAFSIKVEGITDEGLPFVSTKRFNVSYNP